jgi:GWxTD domain-containing protein
MGQIPFMTPGRPDERGPRLLFYEVVNLPGRDSTHSRLDILYRIDRSFFVAVRNNDPLFPYPFVRRGEVSVDRIGKDGESVGRKFSRIEIGEQDETKPAGEHLWYTGLFSVEVAPGKFPTSFQAEDLESDRTFKDASRTVEAASFAGTTPAFSTPLFVFAGSDSLLLTPLAYGGDLLFGARCAMYLAWTDTDGDGSPVNVSYEVYTEEPDHKQALKDSLTGLVPRRGYTLVGNADSGQVTYRLVPSERRDLFSLIIPFPAEQLQLRESKLSIKIGSGDQQREVTHRFKVVWPDMPMSLRDVEYALASLRFVTNDRELDSLSSGDFEKKRDNLEQFWKSKDPTPGTAYNEVMAQYYRRMDYAMREFTTLKQPDGARTDRGMIYVLYGQADRIERSLDPTAGYQETWLYDRLRKKFTFADETRSGNYVLKSTSSQ